MLEEFSVSFTLVKLCDLSLNEGFQTFVCTFSIFSPCPALHEAQQKPIKEDTVVARKCSVYMSSLNII